MSRVQRVPVQQLTEDAFRPFGELLSRKERPSDFKGVNSMGWNVPFEVDDAPVLMTLSSSQRGFQFTKMERHLTVTQAFVPIGRVPAIVAVAAPTDASSVPLPEDVTAFIIDGTVGYMFHKGTWHSLDRYPLSSPSAETVIITSRKTQAELETRPQGKWVHTQQVDYKARFDVIFELDVEGVSNIGP